MGTGGQPHLLVRMGKLLTSLLISVKGPRYRSRLVDKMAFGSYNKRFEPARTDKDWLSKDEQMVDAYLADERCGFIFTLNAYHSMFSGIDRLYDKQFLQHMSKDLPVLFVSGEDDPVGDFAQGVRRVVKSFEEAGMQQLQLKLYPQDRHEILNETDRLDVYRDIWQWLEQQLP